MNHSEAMAALKPFTSQVPKEALDWIRGHWNEAEPILLEEIDEKLKTPASEDRDARFLYAIHLCAEMKCADAFPRYLALCRLPNVVLDHVLGDILTETMPEMLARTCAGRLDELHELIEDSSVNEFARGTALEALRDLMLEGEITRETLSATCTSLLRGKLERRASNIWDTVIHVAVAIHADGVLPLIEKAYERGLVDPGIDRLERIQKEFTKSVEVVLEHARKSHSLSEGTEHAMGFFVGQWSDNDTAEEDDNKEESMDLLSVLKGKRKIPSVASTWVAGRNDPCPCGSGRKFKKCCLGQPSTETFVPISVMDRPVPEKHRLANDWMEAGNLYLEDRKYIQVLLCWKNCWREIRALLPATLQNPDDAEETGAFEGEGFLSNWLEDFGLLLLKSSEKSIKVLKYTLQFFLDIQNRFPLMPSLMRDNLEENIFCCLILLGDSEKARGEAEKRVIEIPEKAQGYVLLSALCSWDASKYNQTLDLPSAIQYLERALDRANDCEDYDIAEQLENLKEWQKSMEKAL